MIAIILSATNIFDKLEQDLLKRGVPVLKEIPNELPSNSILIVSGKKAEEVLSLKLDSKVFANFLVLKNNKISFDKEKTNSKYFIYSTKKETWHEDLANKAGSEILYFENEEELTEEILIDVISLSH